MRDRLSDPAWPRPRLQPGVTLTPELSRPRRAGRAARGGARRHRAGAAVHAAHAALRQADVGDDEQLRAARLGHRRGARLSLSGDAPGNRRAVAADPGDHPAGVARARRLRARARGLPDQLLRAERAHGPASGQGRAGFFRAGGVALARRHRAVSRRRAEAQRSDALGAARLRRRGRARRRGTAGVSRRRSHSAEYIDAAAGRRADQSDAAESRRGARPRSCE